MGEMAALQREMAALEADAAVLARMAREAMDFHSAETLFGQVTAAALSLCLFLVSACPLWNSPRVYVTCFSRSCS